jgi:hypothetical protein
MNSRVLVLMALLAGSSVSLVADTLVLRNGTRVQGRLIGVRDGVVEFEESRGFGTRRLRVDQDEVRAIEFDEEPGERGDGLQTRPRGLRERELQVSARAAWTETGISVRAGQTVYFSADGQVRWGSGRRDGPEGESNSPRNPNRPIPSRPAAALIGRVGDEAPFFIGDDEGPIRVRGSGPLFLGINDDVFEDNTGAFRVTVFY